MILGSLSKRFIIALSTMLIGPFCGASAFAEDELTEKVLENFVRAEISFDKNFATPSEFLGFAIGSRHVSYGEWKSYAKYLCSQSNRLDWVENGITHGQRPMGYVICTSPARLEAIDEIERERKRFVWEFDKSNELIAPPANLPLAVYLGASVHGDELSGMNCSMLIIYLLAAGKGNWIDSILDHQIIVVDGCLNPDGADRFVNWVNDQRGKQPSANSSDREHNMPWPGGRTNHYGFDLNRDWLPATQPETLARLAIYFKWLPNVMIDFHEMGTHHSLFFQPGIDGRDNPLSPAFVREMTQNFATAFSTALDANNERYFTRERFDDFYPGKGSTFPDLHGSIGILVEQGSTEGLVHEYGSKTRTFAETIRNPLLIAIKTLECANQNRRSLMEYQRSFFKTYRQIQNEVEAEVYCIELPTDRRIQREWLSLLERQHVDAYYLEDNEAKEICSGMGVQFIDGRSWIVVPKNQAFGLFVQSMMERTTTFPFEEFYDVSAWNMADAFGLKWFQSKLSTEKLNRKIKSSDFFASRKLTRLDPSSLAIVVPGEQINKMTLLHRLSSLNIDARTAKQTSRVKDSEGVEKCISSGSLCILRGDHVKTWDETLSKLNSILDELDLSFEEFQVGKSIEGPDLGSDQFIKARLPRLALLCGRGASVTSAGSLWFALDNQLRLPVTRIDADIIVQEKLSPFSCLVVPDCTTSFLTDEAVAVLRKWVNEGGHLILTSGSVFYQPRMVMGDEATSEKLVHQTSGYIIEAELPKGSIFNHLSDRYTVPVFQSSIWWQVKGDPSLEIAASNHGLLAGFLPAHERENSRGKMLLGQFPLQKGRVTAMTFDPTFRGHYWGTLALFADLLIEQDTTP